MTLLPRRGQVRHEDGVDHRLVGVQQCLGRLIVFRGSGTADRRDLCTVSQPTPYFRASAFNGLPVLASRRIAAYRSILESHGPEASTQVFQNSLLAQILESHHGT
ncbi:hypothetical protein AB0K23_37325 [Streptomyces sp. NPDC049602]|uniref:hypothetical protein n=1 Tax=Streptomyces sp. NPDC049602 TaxID=3155504 RepID=UPI003443804C